MSSLPIVLSFGVSDCIGAAGMQADQLAVASMGCHPASVITAISAGEARDGGWLVIEEEQIEAQAQAVLQNMPVTAIKVGTLGSIEQVQPIAAVLADVDSVPVVLDPDFDNTPDEEAAGELAAALRELLVPQATVITINLAQARRFVGLTEEDEERSQRLAAADCARELVGWGAEFVLLTDAEPGSALVVNALYDDGGLVRSDSLPRVDVSSTGLRGAGDTLSAALAGLLAQGLDVPEAAQEASQYTAAALVHAFHAGIGMAVPDRLFWAGDEDDEDDDDEAAAEDGGGSGGGGARVN
jgi:hydroxymethylpyrimidine/phosphomethylpyrimidine kinase